MKTVLLALTVLFLCPSPLVWGGPVESTGAGSNIFPANCSVLPPDISDWQTIQTSRIEFRLSEQVVAYLGLDVEYADYRNPADSSEFVRIISRHRPTVFAKPKLSSERLFAEVGAEFYADKEHQDMLAVLEKELDPIIYMYWRTTKNPRTGKDSKGGDFRIWFMPSDGSCHIVQNEKLEVQFLSENVGNGKLHNVFVGVKYQIGDVYHILKVNRDEIGVLTKERK